METLKYKIIRTKTQYKEYCQILEGLVSSNAKSKAKADEIDLLTLLIEKWDEEHNTFKEVNPIQLLHSFLDDHNLKAKDLAEILNVSKGYVSDILNYKKGLSKDVIRTLADYFKVSQEAFNRPYKLKLAINTRFKNASVMNTTKEFALAH
jgi:HTH-type transcriptional regulator / antitoxin HigA